MKRAMSGWLLAAAAVAGLSGYSIARAEDVKPAPKIEMVKVPGGVIDLLPVDADGKVQADGAASKVEVKPFSISKTEITWDQYEIWSLMLDLTTKDQEALAEKEKDLPKHAKSRPSKPYAAPDEGWGHENFAVIHIHSQAAQEFCKWMSAKTGKKYRLPTEAEWEYACRAGKSEEPAKSKEELDQVAWFSGNSADPDTGDLKTHQVGTKKANELGIHDMLGNAAEWVVGQDGKLVVKGGSYKAKAKDVTSRYRMPNHAAWQERDPQDPKSSWWLSDGFEVGFRVVCEE